MFENFIAFATTDGGKVLVPAAIGAIIAVLTILLKDIILHEIRESRKERKELLHTKISKIYGPLYTVVVSSKCTLSTFFYDDDSYKLFVENQHLLSEELMSLINELMALGSGVPRERMYTVSEQRQVLEITEKFSVQIDKEMKKLRAAYK
ncbi:hypothetical protein ACN2MB_004689 [Vibrio parahaemolyticus]|uniref:hypothetical protein n=1 Tax=Vibrio parahaemolyticus TaxID=670 RepID=UPI001120AF22|nr:hypothetical protein [Vibrio parahaemolyticus]TOI86315.1 hypothetical protein CGI50_24490 [Vibrio parahaemolyticus]